MCCPRTPTHAYVHVHVHVFVFVYRFHDRNAAECWGQFVRARRSKDDPAYILKSLLSSEFMQ
jgi:hypothetical protein